MNKKIKNVMFLDVIEFSPSMQDIAGSHFEKNRHLEKRNVQASKLSYESN